MVVKYIAFNWDGQRLEGVLDVGTEEDARRLLERDNLIPYRLDSVRPRGSLLRFLPNILAPKPKELIDFTRGVAALLTAGIPLREALSIMREQCRDMVLKQILGQVLESVESGVRFSEACSRFPRVFPGFYVSLLRVSEATGGMAVTMDQLAKGMEKSKAIKDKVKGALIYPAFTLGVAILVGMVLILYTLPALVGLLSEFGGELPITTRLLISFSDAATGNTTYVLAAILGLPAALLVYTRTPSGARVRDRVMLKVPVVSTVIERMSLFGLTATMSSLLESGIPIMEALRLSKQSVTNVVYRERLERVTEETSQGVRLGVAFRNHWPSPPVLSSGIATGETSGTLVPALRSLAEYFEQEAARAAGAATELIQPVIMVVVAGAVGFVAIAVISGVYSTVGAIK